MIATLKSNIQTYSDLSAQHPYFIIGIEADDYRILNDQGQPYLYPAVDFKIIDAQEPSDWVSEYGEEGERYAYPPSLNAVGFFEDFFDHKPYAIQQFWQTLNQRLALAA